MCLANKFVMMDVKEPTCFKTAMVVPHKTLMGPGPSNYPDRVREALGNPLLGHMQPETFKIMDDIKEGVKYLFQTNNPLTLCVSACGHGGMEAGLANLVEDGESVLIAICGIWGERAADIAKRHGAVVHQIKKQPGECVSLEEVREQFKLHKPSLFFIAHGESSAGLLQNLDGFGDLCREFNCLFMVDAVITMGCVGFYVDRWKIDVAYSGSQKVLNGPPGITPITFGARAIDKMKSRKSLVKSYLFDMHLLGEYWNCFPNSKRIYHHTACATLLYGLRESIALFIEQGGLEASFKRHAVAAARLYKNLESHNFKYLVKNSKNRAPCVTAVIIPDDVDPFKVAAYAMKHYNFEVAGGLGPTVGKIFRIGLMGNNATVELADKIVSIIVEAIEATKDEQTKAKI